MRSNKHYSNSGKDSEVILTVYVIVALFYVVALFYPSWFTYLGVSTAAIAWQGSVQYLLVAVPVFVGFVAIMLIGTWIGFTMATTPPPKPIEEITAETESTTETEEKQTT